MREVTAAEIAHYGEHGWVKLESFIPPAAFSHFAPPTVNGVGHPVIG